jgi:uncharacterized protein (DUF433 family)
MQIGIHDRGRGPEIIGTRITVYDILDYDRMGWDADKIANWLQLTVEQVRMAQQYIKEHESEVQAEYAEMLAFAARGNPPEIQARLQANRAKLLARLNDRQRAIVERVDREIEDERRAAGHRHHGPLPVNSSPVGER